VCEDSNQVVTDKLTGKTTKMLPTVWLFLCMIHVETQTQMQLWCYNFKTCWFIFSIMAYVLHVEAQILIHIIKFYFYVYTNIILIKKL